MAGGSQRVYKQRIKSTETLKKVFRAMEMIAASRIGRARKRVSEGTPFSQAVTQAVAAVASHAQLEHPMLREREDTKRVAVLVITSDRGMAGAYSANVLREAERTIQELQDEGKEPVLYVSGRRGISFFRFRGMEIERTWEGSSDNPQGDESFEIADALAGAFMAPVEEGGVAEVYTISTRFVSMVRQVVEKRRMLPIEVVQADEGEPSEATALPLYEFEPNADEVLNGLLPLYLRVRVHNQVLHSAASELASRQSAMHTATDNAQELISNYTRLANTARQADITQEITEIVSGADSLGTS